LAAVSEQHSQAKQDGLNGLHAWVSQETRMCCVRPKLWGGANIPERRKSVNPRYAEKILTSLARKFVNAKLVISYT
jgi:hypothetical protein